jgi:CheY-like chemotaxis protein
MRVFLVDDSPLVIHRVVELISVVPGVEIVGKAVNVSGAQKAIRHSNPDVVILDVHLPGGSGIEVLQSVKKEKPATIVIVFTNYPEYREKCINLGADFFLDKFAQFDKIFEILLGLSVVKEPLVVGRPGGKRSPAGRLAKLIFDSFGQPLPAGVRSFQGAPRHLVFRSGPILVDVRLEAAHHGNPASLAGQVLDHSNPGRVMKDISISVRSGPQEIAFATTNQLGEFHLDLGSISKTDFHLAVWTEPSWPIIIPLSGIDLGGRPS